MRIIVFLCIIFCFGCNNERIIQLPEIESAAITEILDVSPAYIFYDEKERDSSLLNRKNLISTTNWLVNVDKRLLLRQAIPHIKYLQEKKRNASIHKNEKARNYYTCNDTVIKNLGFIDFTAVNYHEFKEEDINVTDTTQIMSWVLKCYKDNSIRLRSEIEDFEITLNLDNMSESLKIINDLLKKDQPNTIIILFEHSMTFQQYITIKNSFQQLNNSRLKISDEEYIFH